MGSPGLGAGVGADGVVGAVVDGGVGAGLGAGGCGCLLGRAPSQALIHLEGDEVAPLRRDRLASGCGCGGRRSDDRRAEPIDRGPQRLRHRFRRLALPRRRFRRWTGRQVWRARRAHLGGPRWPRTAQGASRRRRRRWRQHVGRLGRSHTAQGASLRRLPRSDDGRDCGRRRPRRRPGPRPWPHARAEWLRIDFTNVHVG